jgi:hypothetical protein
MMHQQTEAIDSAKRTNNYSSFTLTSVHLPLYSHRDPQLNHQDLLQQEELTPCTEACYLQQPRSIFQMLVFLYLFQRQMFQWTFINEDYIFYNLIYLSNDQ